MTNVSFDPASASDPLEPPAPEGTSLRILVVSTRLPYPPSWGFARRVFHLAESLAHRHRVTMLCYVTPDDRPEAQTAFSSMIHELVTVPVPREGTAAKRSKQALSLFSRTPFHVRAVRDPGLQGALDDLLRREQFDVVQIESSQLGWLRFPEGTRLVVDEHNIESEVLGRMAKAEVSLIRRSFNGWESHRYRAFEKRVWCSATACATTSDRDAQAISSACPALMVSAVPNGVDCEEFSESGQPAKAGALVFTGLLRYRPNVDGVVWFLAEVYPLIRVAHPDVHLTVVGDGPDDVLESLRVPGVTVTGWVEDVRPYMEDASVVVVPLRMGGGTRLKVVEALSMSKAIVSTTLGSEGIDVESGIHVVLADDARSFADAVVDLLRDQRTAKRLGAAGRALAEERYSWARSAAILEELHSRVAQGDRAGTGGLA